MNDQLTKQAADLRGHLETLGFTVSPTPSGNHLLEATIPSGRNRWVAVVFQDPEEKLERLDMKRGRS